MSLPGWWPLGLVTVLYVAQVLYYIGADRIAMAIVFSGYALANLGLILDF